MSKEQEAMEAVREIEKSKGTLTDPAQPKGQPTPAEPVKEPAKSAQVPPAPKKEEPVKKEPPAPDPLSELKSENEKLRKQNEETIRRLEAIERQKAQVPPEKKQPENNLAQFSDDDLILYKGQHPEYSLQIEKELHRRTQERAEESFTKRYERDRTKSAYDAAAYQAWPDLRNPNSDHAMLTAQIYNADPAYAQHPQGYYVAAQAARTQLVEKELSFLRSTKEDEAEEQKKLSLENDRKKRENGLHTGGRAPETPPSDDDNFEKSLDDLPSARPGSPEYLAHLRVLEKRKNKSA